MRVTPAPMFFTAAEMTTLAFALSGCGQDEARGARTGSFESIPQSRTFNFRWITPGEASASNLEATPDASQEYSGQPIRFKRNTP
jgi:hypothetical protein